jgi:hypothetical protein
VKIALPAGSVFTKASIVKVQVPTTPVVVPVDKLPGTVTTMEVDVALKLALVVCGIVCVLPPQVIVPLYTMEYVSPTVRSSAVTVSVKLEQFPVAVILVTMFALATVEKIANMQNTNAKADTRFRSIFILPLCIPVGCATVVCQGWRCKQNE